MLDCSVLNIPHVCQIKSNTHQCDISSDLRECRVRHAPSPVISLTNASSENGKKNEAYGNKAAVVGCSADSFSNQNNLRRPSSRFLHCVPAASSIVQVRILVVRQLLLRVGTSRR